MGWEESANKARKTGREQLLSIQRQHTRQSNVACVAVGADASPAAAAALQGVVNGAMAGAIERQREKRAVPAMPACLKVTSTPQCSDSLFRTAKATERKTELATSMH
jgi:hypothetical protein